MENYIIIIDEIVLAIKKLRVFVRIWPAYKLYHPLIYWNGKLTTQSFIWKLKSRPIPTARLYIPLYRNYTPLLPPVGIYDSVLYTSIWKEVMRVNWVMKFWPFHPFYTKTSVGEENFDECVRCTKLLSDLIALIFVMFRSDLMESF